MRDRVLIWTEEKIRADALPPEPSAMLEAVLYRGEPSRGEVAQILGTGERQARRVTSALPGREVLVSDGGQKGRNRQARTQSASAHQVAHATWQAEQGAHESVLQGLLGHAKGSRITKQFYVQAPEDAERAAVIALPLGEIKEGKSA